MAHSYETADWADTLGTVPLFAGLSHRHLRAIAKMGKVQVWEERAPIVRRGDKGDAFYLVLEGAAVVRVPGRRLVKLGVGDYFGELALLDEHPRTATVEASTRSMTMRIGQRDFLRMLQSEPKVALRMARTLAARLREAQQGPTA